VITLVAVFAIFWVPFFTLTQARTNWWLKVDSAASYLTPVGSLWSRHIYAPVASVIREKLRGSTGYVLTYPLALNSQLPELSVLPA